MWFLNDYVNRDSTMSSSQVLLNGHSAVHTPEPAHGVMSTFVISQDYQDIETEPVHDVISKIVISHDLQTVRTEANHVPEFVTSNDHDDNHELQIIDTEPAQSQTSSKFAVSPRIEKKTENNNEIVKPKFAISHDHRPIETKPANTSKSFAIPHHDLQTIKEDEEVAGLNELKKMTTRLRLSTRRPSIMQWRENLTNFQQNRGMSLDHDMDDDAGGSWTEEEDDDVADGERRRKMDDAIAWLRQELTTMKTQDHQLAMQLMKLRAEIQELKLQKTSNEHQELIEDARYSIVEENEELKSALFDLPMNNHFFALNGGDDPLKDIGVTRMNLNRRRFSLR